MKTQIGVFNDTYAYLEQNIFEGFYCEDFSQKHSHELYSILTAKYPEDEITLHRFEIRRAFKSYFELLNQKVSIFFQGLHTIVIKDLQKQIFGEYSKQFHQVTQRLTFLIEEIEEYRLPNGLYLISKERLSEVDGDFENIEDPSLKKELYKKAVKSVLDLHPRDIVFCINKNLAIKKFEAINESELSKSKQIERRAAGLPQEELEKIKNLIFEKNISDEISKSMKNLMQKKLNFSKINNNYFKKNALIFIQEELYKLVSMYMNEDEDMLLKKAFANYILRENFTAIYEQFANRLLDLHTKRDKNVENFLKYFDGNKELVEDTYIQKPDIIDTNSNRWNVLSILPIAIQKQKNDKEIELIENTTKKIQEKLLTLEEKIETIENENLLLKKQEGDLNTKIREIIEQSQELQEKNMRLKQKRNKAPKKDQESLQTQINELVLEIKKLHQREETLRTSIKEITDSIDKNSIKITNLHSEIHTQERIMQESIDKKENQLKLHEPVQQKYSLIRSAIAKALMSKY